MFRYLQRALPRLAFFLAIIVMPISAHAQSAGLQAALKGLSKSERGILAYYQSNGYRPIFAGSKNQSRRTALIGALKASGSHGLPMASYQPKELETLLRRARSDADIGKAEVAAARVFVRYANHMYAGVLTPSRVDSELAYRPKRVSAEALLAGIAKGNAKGYLAGLMPKHADYQRLVKEYKRLRNKAGSSIPDIPLKTLKPGVSSNAVALMRQKLSSQGYGNLGTSTTYDPKLVEVVKKFQASRGLAADGVAGPATLRSMNLGPRDQLSRVIVNMERQRWLNFNRGKTHLFVNIPEYTVKMYEGQRVAFESRVVVGKALKDFRTVEFVDQMTHMVINPTWHVPASIAGKEYLPILQNDPSYLARQNMRMLDENGNSVNPASLDLSAYDENNFPYNIKQRPDPANALGRVKFMFPNRYNIYMHDTPAKSLFSRENRAFSHGCIRVHKPFDFAQLLLSKQMGNAKGYFQGQLNTGAEQYVNLKQPIPVIIAYQTVTFENNKVFYRGDIYGRDAKIAKALRSAGVAI